MPDEHGSRNAFAKGECCRVGSKLLRKWRRLAVAVDATSRLQRTLAWHNEHCSRCPLRARRKLSQPIAGSRTHHAEQVLISVSNKAPAASMSERSNQKTSTPESFPRPRNSCFRAWTIPQPRSCLEYPPRGPGRQNARKPQPPIAIPFQERSGVASAPPEPHPC